MSLYFHVYSIGKTTWHCFYYTTSAKSWFCSSCKRGKISPNWPLICQTDWVFSLSLTFLQSESMHTTSLSLRVTTVKDSVSMWGPCDRLTCILSLTQQLLGLMLLWFEKWFTWLTFCQSTNQLVDWWFHCCSTVFSSYSLAVSVRSSTVVPFSGGVGAVLPCSRQL